MSKPLENYIIINNLEPKEMAEITIDNTAWRINKHFKGFRQVPPGVHLIYIGSNKDKSIFVHLGQKSTVIIDIEKETGRLILMPRSNSLHNIYTNACEAQEIQPYLAIYRVEDYQLWHQSTFYISRASLNRVFKSYTVSYPEFADIDLKALARANYEQQLSNNFSYVDRTDQLLNFIKYEYEGEPYSVVADLQLAYVCFVTLENLDAWKHFQAISYLFCESDSIYDRHSALGEAFLKAFFVILKQFPDDFFYSDLSKENYLSSAMKHLMETLIDKPGYVSIYQAYEKLLRGYFKFEWKEILKSEEDGSLFVNELLTDGEQPIIVAETEYISFD